MRLTKVNTDCSPDRPGYVRMTGHVALADDGRGDPHQIWIDVPEALAPGLSVTGNPWAFAMFPLALERGATIQSDLPVDSLLADNLRALSYYWPARRFPGRRVTFDLASEFIPAGGDKIMCFASGGVDSWHTAIRRVGSPAAAPIGDLDEFLFVLGFDQALTDRAAFAQRISDLKPMSDILERPLVDVATNLRQYGRQWTFGWGSTHFLGRTFIAFALERRYRLAVWAAGRRIDQQDVPGSDLSLEGMLASNALRCQNDGHVDRRVDKILFLARDGRSIDHLRVCLIPDARENCGRCEKCVRTMATLELAGRLKGCKSFPNELPMDRLGRFYLPTNFSRVFAMETVELAEAGNRPDIAAACRRSLRRSAAADIPFGVARSLPAGAHATKELIKRIFGFV